MKNRSGFAPKNALILVLCSFIWGTAFVAQSVGNTVMGPASFLAARGSLSLLLLAVLVIVRRHFAAARRAAGDKTVPPDTWGKAMRKGFLCGLFMTAAMLLQQWGLVGAKTGKGGFITAMYIVLVPVLTFFMTGKTRARTWISVGIAVIGMYFLCAANGLSGIDRYDLMLLGSALLYSVQIIMIDHFAQETDAVEFCMAEFIPCVLVCTAVMFLFEKPVLQSFADAWFPIFYAGILSGGVGYTLQIVGQKGQDPAIASLLMSLESVFAVLAGWVLQGQVLSGSEAFGCVLMFCAIILAQLPERKRTS